MPKRAKDIRLLLQRSEKLLIGFMDRYVAAKSLGDPIDDAIKLEIKEFLEHLKSCLDYLANDLREMYHPDKNKGADGKASFPLAENRVQSAQRIKDMCPQLDVSFPALFQYLGSLNYENPDAIWLRHFNQARNKHTHRGFLNAQASKAYSSVRFGHGTTVVLGGVRGGSVSYAPIKTASGEMVTPTVCFNDDGSFVVNRPDVLTVKYFDQIVYEFDDGPLSAAEVLELSLVGVKTVLRNVSMLVFNKHVHVGKPQGASFQGGTNTQK